jgi:hypothetical protein
MSAQDAQSSFDALQMGAIYFDEIGDELALKELKSELECLLEQRPELAEQASFLLNSFFSPGC